MGITELLQTKGIGEGLLHEGLLGEHRRHTIRSLVAEWGIEEDELLNRAELFYKLIHAQARPDRLGLAMKVL